VYAAWAEVDDCDLDGYTLCAGDCQDFDYARHPGALESCDSRDNDCDNLVDEDNDGDGRNACNDCQNANPGVYAVPTAIDGLTVGGPRDGGFYRLDWTSQADTAGPATVYDVFSGSMSSLGAAGDFSAGSCLADNGGNYLDESIPAPAAGEVIYYLVRAQNACPGGTGTYGSSNRDATSSLSPMHCN
jgi:hypothetical protein